MTLISVLGTAAGAGFLHVILGPDHIAAIMTVSACQGAAALWYGVRWGVGHSMGLVFVALLLWFIDAESDMKSSSFTLYASYFSGIFMIAFGVYFIRDIIANDKSGLGFSAVATSAEYDTQNTPDLPDSPEESMSDPVEAPTSPKVEKMQEEEAPLPKSALADRFSSASIRQAAASLCAGIVGGIAGPGGVLAIVPASYYSTRIEAVTYIMVFITASTGAMALMAYAYGRITSNWVMNSLNRQQQETKLKLISAIASVVVGILWIILTALNVIQLD